MKSHFPAVVVVASLLGGGAFAATPDTTTSNPSATAPSASAVPGAQPDAGTPADAGAQPDAGARADTSTREKSARTDDTASRFGRADRAALFDAHLAALHAGLTLTPEQDKLWPALDQAIRGVAQMRMDLRNARMDLRNERADQSQGQDQGNGASMDETTEDPIARLKVTGEHLLERGKALQALAEAAAPLYASLSEEQKHRLPMLLRDIAPRGGPVGRMVAALGAEQRGSGAADEADRGAMDRDGADYGGMDRARGDMRHGDRAMRDREMGGDYGSMQDRDEPRDQWRGHDRMRDRADDRYTRPDDRWGGYENRDDSQYRNRDDSWFRNRRDERGDESDRAGPSDERDGDY